MAVPVVSKEYFLNGKLGMAVPVVSKEYFLAGLEMTRPS